MLNINRTYIILATLLALLFVFLPARGQANTWATNAELNNCAYGSVNAGDPNPREYFEAKMLGEPDGDTLRLCGAYCTAVVLLEFENGIYNDGVTLRVRHEDWRNENQYFSVLFYNPEFMPNSHIAQKHYLLKSDETEWKDLYFSSDGKEFSTVMIAGDTTTCGGEFDAVQALGYVRDRSQVFLPYVP